MEFINPGLAGLAALAAVPLLIHLLHRPRPKSRKFPSLLFLRKCARRSRAFASLRNLALMAIRMAAVALLALAIARPKLAGSAPGGGEHLAAALVLDDSFRMGYGEAGLSRFDDARRRAMDVLASLPPASESAVLFASGESTELTVDSGAAEVALRRSKESSLAVPVLPSVVEAARALKNSKATRREIHVFTDLARFAWSGTARESLAALAGFPVFIHDVAKDKAVNAAVAKVELIPSVPREGRPVEIVATIASWGRAEPVAVMCRIAGATTEEKMIAIPDGGTAVLRFRGAAGSGPVLHGTVSVATPDPLPIDGVRHFAVPVGGAPRILVVEPEPDAGRAPFISFALAPPSFERSASGVTVTAPADLAAFDFGAVDVIIVSEPLAVGDKVLQRLAAWVHNGGGLAVLAVPRTPSEPLEAMMRAGLYPPVKGSIETAARLAPGSSDGPAFHAFRAGRNGDLTSATVTRRVSFGAQDGWRPALMFDDGSPAVMETLAGRGRVLALGFEASTESTDLPRFPCFVPLMHEIARYLAGTKSVDREFEAGTPVLLPLSKPSGAAEYRMTDLANNITETRAADPSSPALPVARSLAPGRYQVEIGDALRTFAVNVDTAGSDSTRLARADVERLLPGATVSFSFQRASASEIREARLGHELTLAALVAVVLLLLIELWIARAP